jgi:hypothetical protein
MIRRIAVMNVAFAGFGRTAGVREILVEVFGQMATPD